ncbi:MAG: sulfatase-like hydrolase/transferase [Bacteroidales bacterium]|nr:sulfatase-like hydrolase/transferase [Bacteroidales bacterium]
MTLRSTRRPVAAVLWNLGLAYLVYMLCRVAYALENWSLFGAGFGSLSVGSLLSGSLRFDTSAIIYTNSLYVVLTLLPLHIRFSKAWQAVSRWLYVVINSLAVVINLVDAVYSQYTGRRTTATFFAEFSHESNLGSILGIELWHHWYLVLAGAALIFLLWWLYRPLDTDGGKHWVAIKWLRRKGEAVKLPASLFSALALLLYLPLAVIGMRGGATRAIRPITISNANQYVNSPTEAAIVLNTPFSLIRTAGKTTFRDPAYFSPTRLDSLYSPLHRPDTASAPLLAHSHPNVVILIVESLAQEYIGAYNSYPCATPFLDSLIGQSLTFDRSFCNGRKSIDGMPSILSSIPMFVEPYFVSSYSLNRVSGVAGELGRYGYTSAFFHGAENGSMGFQAYARASGFQRYLGRTEYNADPRFGGEADFDGTWAIWDEEFLQFYALTMSEMRQPFCTALFTASSHHPYHVPDRYRDSLALPGHPMHTCIRYVDHSLRQFFRTAQQQPWYDSTLFVITADHTNITEHPEYRTDLGYYRVPIIFFDPSGRLPRGRHSAIAQQIDIMPTLLGIMGYPSPYVAFGIDLLRTPADSTWAVNYNNGIYQYVSDSLLLQFDGSRLVGHYNYLSDPLLQRNLDPSPALDHRLDHLKAIIQSYMQRMVADQLTAE